jgi:pyruvate formate lyase activating enzyme
MRTKGIVFDLQRFSIHDGPGIRTVIFFKGCPLQCRWCQNPEGLDPEPGISFSKEKCLGCRECWKVCPVEAIMFEGMKRIDRRLCDRCGRCVEVCYAEALQIIGKS